MDIGLPYAADDVRSMAGTNPDLPTPLGGSMV
jgi:hypothetical protein